MKTTVLPSRRGPKLKETLIEWVEPESIVVTDEWPAYNGLNRHFILHSRINYSTDIYLQGDTHTDTIEGFFGNVKTGMRGNYKKVSHKWLQGSLNEFAWRYNHRHYNDSLFHLLIARAAQGV